MRGLENIHLHISTYTNMSNQEEKNIRLQEAIEAYISEQYKEDHGAI